MSLNRTCFRHVVAIVVFGITTAALAMGDTLESGFLNPPEQARPFTYYFWMDGNLTKEGLTKNVQAMKEVGLGGFRIFHIGAVVHRIPPSKG